MNALTLIMSLVLIGTLFVSDLHNMLMTTEMITIMTLALPIYFYKKRQPVVWNSFLLIMTLAVASRFVTTPYVIANADVVQLPVSIANQTIKQFAGIGVMTVWFIWYIFVFASTLFDNHIIIKESNSLEKIDKEFKTGTMRVNMNFYNTTCFVLSINFMSAIFIYDMGSIWVRVLINIIIVLITNIAYKAFIKDDIKGRLESIINSATSSHHRNVDVYDVNSDTIIECENLSKESKIAQDDFNSETTNKS